MRSLANARSRSAASIASALSCCAFRRAARASSSLAFAEMRAVSGWRGSNAISDWSAICWAMSAAAAADIAQQIADQSLIALDPRQPETARISANAKLELARAARRKAQHESALAIEAAERDLALANERIRLANATAASAYQEGE